ncbi:substrate-binding periplasmic protein [Marinomonas algicola]|uniref:substrate-binding periplasmic protein n=1 Tax=Marinomonas algicola TaxID=2773454 RepID=UPI00174A35EA|nr:transporter substrate-binding domain-containing protein [Marinomonas algicola]
MKSLIFLWMFFIPSALMAKNTVTFYIGEWPPYTSEDHTKEYLAEVLVEESFHNQGYSVRFEYHPWKRGFSSVNLGNVDGTFPWYKTQQREKQFILSKEALFREKQVFFHLKSTDFQWETYDDLKAYQVGGTVGYYDTTLLEENGVNVFVTTDERFNFKMLMAGRIDAYPSGSLVGYEVIKSLFSPEEATLFTTHPKVIKEGGMHVLFSKQTQDGQELADAFDRGIRRLKASGRYKEILSSFTN